MSDDAFESQVRERLDAVERSLSDAVDSDEAFVAEAATHLLRAGGKRFRPLLVLLTAEFGDPSAADIVPAALVVELTHLATLYHDDVMDEAALRRGAQSANARWDNSIAILTGDYLFARASHIVADLGPEAVRIQADTFSRLVQGQIRETTGPRAGEDPLSHYLSVVADKTGALIATSARFGAMMAGAPTSVQDRLTEFGERIGSAFQLSDDIIDVASDAHDSGKTPGTDLREGVPTLPTLIALSSDAPDDARLRELLSGPISNDDDHAEALALLREHPALDDARAFVRRWSDDARALLTDLPPGIARDALESLCDTVVTRIG
ncbi:polyprenyl synthetase family protein [Solicola gregarius]|uniref:Polyprenyl synthetase family protein n=1 Tax=Solicola gregarius TaxID=2908642 RepID=A0AA46TE73_9ACTN|nr:polyprenyl synthetase family protein [Solicola gregarius]UYM03691.1 polyprenyl synthetase family protein [Solicola gregarius]